MTLILFVLLVVVRVVVVVLVVAEGEVVRAGGGAVGEEGTAESREEMSNLDLHEYLALAKASPADEILGLEVEFGKRASLDDLDLCASSWEHQKRVLWPFDILG
jgi:hypothetical protein